MKKLIITLAILLSCTVVQAETEEDYSSDYAFHYAAGAVISGVTLLLLPNDWDPWTKRIVAVGAAVLTKTIIESFDDPFDSRDIFHYGFGGVISVTLIEVAF